MFNLNLYCKLNFLFEFRNSLSAAILVIMITPHNFKLSFSFLDQTLINLDYL